MIPGLVIAALLLFIAWQNYRWDQERSKLLQRIQAPQVAIAEASSKPKRKTPAPLPPEADKEWREARGLNV